MTPTWKPYGSVLVLGGSSGIGAATASLLSRAGFHVAAASRRGTAPPGQDSITRLTCDVRDPASVRAAFAAVGRSGPVACVINAAGVGFFAPFTHDHAADWRDIVDTNFLGLLHILGATEELARPLQHLVQIGSLAGTRPSKTPGNDIYAATKAAGALTLSRYREHVRRVGGRTKISLITPGYVGGTDFTRNFYRYDADEQQLNLDQFSPLSPEDVAAAVEYVLCQPTHVELSELVIRPVDQPD
jgi:NADP-dependent 3-hydroxy acid dehydrogenase YdfG